jgi:hypothetical protein
MRKDRTADASVVPRPIRTRSLSRVLSSTVGMTASGLAASAAAGTA